MSDPRSIDQMVPANQNSGIVDHSSPYALPGLPSLSPHCVADIVSAIQDVLVFNPSIPNIPHTSLLMIAEEIYARLITLEGPDREGSETESEEMDGI